MRLAFTKRLSVLLQFLVLIILFNIQNTLASDNSQEVSRQVSDLITQSLDIVSQPASSDRDARARELMSQHLDFDWMANTVLMARKNNLTEEQIQDFKSAYKQYMIASYTNIIKNYKGENIKVTSITGKAPNYTVNSKITKTDGNSINVSFAVVDMGEGNLKIQDISTEKVSLILSQKNEFQEIIKGEGIDNLIDKLNSKNN